MHALGRAISYLRPYWLVAVGAVASLILVTAANLVIPQIIRWVIDDGITPGYMPVIAASALGLIGVAVVRGAFNFTQGFWSEKASQNVAFDVRNALFDKIQSLSFSYHDRAQTGQLMTRLTSDVEMGSNRPTDDTPYQRRGDGPPIHRDGTLPVHQCSDHDLG
jgi:ATP-binding cassette subfamily B protein